MLFPTVLCVLASFVSVLGECNDGCNEPTLFYEGLKCKPKYASPNDCCPSEYDCSNIEQKAAANEEKCYFHGKTYNVGDAINNDEIYGNCQVGCHCRRLKNGNMGFSCAILDCPEWLGYQPGPGCTLKYEINECCSAGVACEEPYNVTCKVGTESYHEGHRFKAPHAKCTNCVCREGFKGKYEAPFCAKQTCIDEARRQNEVYSFCAASFIKLSDCCPIYWICPENDKIVAATTSENSNLKCKFGDKTLNIGDKFERTSGEKGKVSCECRIPPYLTCIQNYEYPTYAPPI